MSTPFPPSKETLAEWANLVAHAHHHLDGFDQTHDLPLVASLLRDERLAAALALWEAVEWIEANSVVVRAPSSEGLLWRLDSYPKPYAAPTVAGGDTLPEAVSALRARLAEKGKE